MRGFLSLVLLVVAFLSACGGSVSSNSNSEVTQTVPAATPSPDSQLQKQIAEIAKEANGKVGIYAVLIETGETVSLNADDGFAMQSVVKLPISMAVLKQVGDGKLDLDEKIAISKDDLVPGNMRSPIRDTNPNGAEMTVSDLIRYAISESDGTAADVLQRVAGGAKAVHGYVDSIGVNEMEVKHSHKEFGAKWERQYENWATPKAAVALLTQLLVESQSGHASDKATTRSLMLVVLKCMIESNNPPNRLKGMLPARTVVAHKTGTGGTQNGITSATNDVGIITLPNGNHIAIAVFVGDSKADLATREAVIAKIAKAVFDKWSTSKPSEPVKQANFTERHTLN